MIIEEEYDDHYSVIKTRRRKRFRVDCQGFSGGRFVHDAGTREEAERIEAEFKKQEMELREYGKNPLKIKEEIRAGYKKATIKNTCRGP